MGLFVIQDLLRHYPRDHVDYSATTPHRGAGRAGETATIVATVRRCNGFVSPAIPTWRFWACIFKDHRATSGSVASGW